MPTLSLPSSWALGLASSLPTNWAGGITRSAFKSLKKRLYLKKVKKRVSDPFNRRVHCYSPSGEGSAPQEPIPTSKSIGTQVSLPSRSLLQELSHSGDLDVMSYAWNSENSNYNNSVGYGGHVSSSNTTPKYKSVASRVHAGHTGKCALVLMILI